MGLVEVWCQVGRWCRVVRRVTDVVGSTPAEAIGESVVLLHGGEFIEATHV